MIKNNWTHTRRDDSVFWHHLFWAIWYCWAGTYFEFTSIQCTALWTSHIHFTFFDVSLGQPASAVLTTYEQHLCLSNWLLSTNYDTKNGTKENDLNQNYSICENVMKSLTLVRFGNNSHTAHVAKWVTLRSNNI